MGDDPPGDDLAEAFWAVARELREASREGLAPWDVTPAQSRALATLLRRGPVRPGVLAEHLRIAPRSATEVVDALEGRGLVERAPDPDDRRATIVGLTPHGTATAEAIRAARAAGADGVFARLAEADRAELARILGLLRG